VRDRAFVEPDRVFVWSVADARVVARLETLGGDIATATAIPARTAPFVGGGALVVDASGAVVRVDALSGEVTPLVAGGDEIASAVTAIAGGTNGSTFAVGRVDGTTAVHDAVTGEVIAHSDGDATAIVSVQADGDGFVTLAASGRIELLAGGTSAVIERHATAEPTSLAMAVDGSLVAVSFADGSVEVRDLDGEVRQRIRTGTGRIDAAAFSPDRSRIATATGQKVGSIAYDDSLRLWNTTADSPTVVTTGPDDIAATIGGEQEDVAGCTFFRNGVAFTPDGRFVVTASHDYTVQLYDIEGGDVEHVFTGPRDSVLGLAVSPGGRFLAAAAEDALVRVWRLDDRELVHELGGGVAGFWSVAFSPTGRVLAASDATGVVRLWDVDSGHAVGELDGVKNTASNLAFSPDGRLLAAGAEASTIGVWDVRSGERLATLDGHLGVVQSVLFSPDGSTLLSAGLDDVARAWRVAP
jgi:WD40 repeat protein